MYENIGTIADTNTHGILFFENEDYDINEWIEATIDIDPMKVVCYTKLFHIEYNEDGESFVEYYENINDEEEKRIYYTPRVLHSIGYYRWR